jgi:drug/metabolite transporter (DMT)-like permease
VGSVTYGALLWRWRGWSPFAAAVRPSPRTLLTSSIAAVGGYLLVLYVLQQAPVSYVVPLRSVSVLLSVLVGSRLLGEQGGVMRLAAAGAILAGISAIAIGG